jgi:hypothetical protein
MNWVTIYITGRTDFREEVRKKLMNADLNVMPGYTDNSQSRVLHDLYWMDEKLSLHDFKKAVGSKLVWKFRLRFYATLEEFIEVQENTSRKIGFTQDEQNLMDTMRKLSA